MKTLAFVLAMVLTALCATPTEAAFWWRWSYCPPAVYGPQPIRVAAATVATAAPAATAQAGEVPRTRSYSISATSIPQSTSGYGEDYGHPSILGAREIDAGYGQDYGNTSVLGAPLIHDGYGMDYRQLSY